MRTYKSENIDFETINQNVGVMIEEEGYNSPEVGTFAYDEFYDYDRYTGWLEHLGRSFLLYRGHSRQRTLK